MASREIHMGDIEHAVEQGNGKNNRKLAKLLFENFDEDDMVTFHFCDDEGLIKFLGLEVDREREYFTEHDAICEYDLVHPDDVAVSCEDHNTQDGKRKIELVQKILELELWEIELLLKPLNEKFNLGISENYYSMLEMKVG